MSEEEIEELKRELQDYQFNYDSIKELTEENEKLKAQIEKMKCCENCKHLKGKCAEQLASFRCENKNDWELAE